MSYKNILWIEDEDTKEALVADIYAELAGIETESPPSELCKDFFRQPACVKQVKYLNAIKDEIKNAENYDLIVFDVNMKNDNTLTENIYEIIDTLKKSGIKIKDAPKKNDNKLYEGNFYEKAGIYLYLFYAINGYPSNRMIVLTGNSEKYCKLEEIIPVNGIVQKDKIRKDYSWIDKFYEKENTYYRVRRLVFQACEYWKEYLEDKEESDISFNRLYFGKNERYYIQKNEFTEKLDSIKLMMPVSRPSKPETIYYQIMKNLSEFHEKKAKIETMEQYPDLKRYHSCMRYFRNWSAHNRLNKKIKTEHFAILFCIALRTYFNGTPEKPILCEKQYEYEENYGFSLCETTDKIGLQKFLQKNFKEMIKTLNYYNPAFSFDEIIREYGKNTEIKIDMKYLLLPLWSDKELFKSKGNIKSKTDCIGENTAEIAITIKKEAKCIFNADCFDKLCKKAEKNNADGFFMRQCAKLLT